MLKKPFFSALLRRHFRAAQHLAPGEKLRLLFEQVLQEVDGVTKIAQLDRCYGLEPGTAQGVAQILFISYRHDWNR